MTMRVLLCVPALILATGCMSSRMPAPEEVHPIVGSWNHTVDTPDGTMAGMLSFEIVNNALVGTVRSEGFDEVWALDDLSINAESRSVTASFDSGVYGIVLLNVTLETEDSISGYVTVADYDLDLPLEGSRADSDEHE